MNNRQYIDDTPALRCADPSVVAAALGLEHDQRAQLKKGGRGYLYYTTPSGEPIVVCQKSRAGVPLWWRPGDAAHAQDWLGLVQHLNPSLSLGQAKAHLRRSLGAPPSHQEPPSSSPLPTPPIPSAPLSLTPAPAWAAAWLAGRGLSVGAIRAALDAGMGGVDLETQGGARVRNLAFPHTNARSDLVGAEIRGSDRKFKGFRGQKGVFTLMPAQSSARLCTTESAIDSLALWDFMRETGREPAWIVSTSGRPSASQLDEVERLACELGITRLIAAQDIDEGGEAQASIFEAMAARMCAEYKRAKPPGGAKDWGEWAERRQSFSSPRPQRY